MRARLNIHSWIIFLMIFISGNTVSQTVTRHDPDQFLFPGFSTCKVAMKVGEDLTLMMNYNIVTEKMVFLQNGEVYEVVDYRNVDTIYLNQMKFVPAGDVFYRVAIEFPETLYIQYRGKIPPPEKPAAYGGTSKVSSSTVINTLVGEPGEAFIMDTNNDLIVERENRYWMDIDGEMSDFENSRQFLRILPEHSSEMRSYIKNIKPDFESDDDVINLVNHYNTLLEG